MTQGTTRGTIDRVPCPWCGQPNNFRPLADEEMGGVGWGNQGLEGGAIAECDHCHRRMKILAVQKAVMVTLTRA